jgi:hypothetical protein
MEDGSLEASAYGAIAAALFGPRRDESNGIRSGFLYLLRAEGPPKMEDVLDSLAQIKEWDDAVSYLSTNVEPGGIAYLGDI